MLKNSQDFERYYAYRLNWEFLPEPLLLTKDYIRRNIVDIFTMASNNNITRPFISKIVDLNIKKTVLQSGKLFIHIPKNAGTSISQLLYGRNLPHFTMGFYQKVSPDIVTAVESFAVIRNPAERFLSSCKFILSKKTDAMLVDRLTMHNFRGCFTIMDFLDRLSRGDDLIGTCLPFQKQSSYVNVDGKMALDFLFSIENGYCSNIESYLGRKMPMLNKTNLDMEISNKEMKIIEEIYRDDFELFDTYKS